MKKSNQRFDYRRFSEQLVDRGLVDADAIHHVLQQCHATGGLLTEVLVQESLVSDWEVGRVCCELLNLPYVPVERYSPSPLALEGLDAAFLRRFCLVPLDRFGGLLTVAMPGLVPSEVLEGLRGEAARVLPFVGSVVSNRRWLNEHLPDPNAGKSAAGLQSLKPPLPHGQGTWADIFDAGEEAVRLDLKDRRQP